MEGFLARKFRVSNGAAYEEQGMALRMKGMTSLGEKEAEYFCGNRSGEHSFPQEGLWERWITPESREKSVKLSTLSTGICG